MMQIAIQKQLKLKEMKLLLESDDLLETTEREKTRNEIRVIWELYNKINSFLDVIHKMRTRIDDDQIPELLAHLDKINNQKKQMEFARLISEYIEILNEEVNLINNVTENNNRLVGIDTGNSSIKASRELFALFT